MASLAASPGDLPHVPLEGESEPFESLIPVSTAAAYGLEPLIESASDELRNAIAEASARRAAFNACLDAMRPLDAGGVPCRDETAVTSSTPKMRVPPMRAAYATVKPAIRPETPICDSKSAEPRSDSESGVVATDIPARLPLAIEWPNAIRRGLRGAFTAHIEVLSDGSAGKIEIAGDTSGYEAMIVRVLKSLRYSPATRGGHPICSILKQTFLAGAAQS